MPAIDDVAGLNCLWETIKQLHLVKTSMFIHLSKYFFNKQSHYFLPDLKIADFTNLPTTCRNTFGSSLF